MALEKVLPLLAGRTAALEWEPPDAGGARVVRFEPEGRQTLGRISRPDRLMAVRNGWLDEDPETSYWRLSPAGRMVVKRLRSGTSMAELRDDVQDVEAGPARKAVRDCTESPLAWLRSRKGRDGEPFIDVAAFEAGERLRRDFEFAQMRPSVTTNWNATGGTSGLRGAPGAGVDLSDNAAASAERVRRALVAVGPELSGLLLDVCCHLKRLEDVEHERGWPRRSGKTVLEIALQSLARHYRVPGAERAAQSQAKIGHWGDSTFRPPIAVPGR
ncbi:MAG: DUF6456 domain-containing protein [Hyphomicrobium sp.]|nr:DUF6456 domain-containing protein [Hyphomicrobium sp.]